MSKVLLTTAAFALAIAATATFGAAPARADANARFCSTIYDKGAPTIQCDYYTYEQCKASISGRGGSCGDNLSLRESQARAPRKR